MDGAGGAAQAGAGGAAGRAAGYGEPGPPGGQGGIGAARRNEPAGVGGSGRREQVLTESEFGAFIWRLTSSTQFGAFFGA